MASAIILLPFYLEYLPAELYGALAVCMSFSIFAQILVTYSFDSSLYIHYHEFKNDPSKLASFISSVFVFLVVWGVVVTVVLSAIGQVIFGFLFPENSSIAFYPYGLMAVGIGAFQAIFKVHSTLLQTREKPEPFLWSNLLSFMMLAILTIIGLQLYPNTLLGPLGARLIVGAGTVGWVLFRVFREFGVHVQSPWAATGSRFNAYTFIYQLQQWGVNYLDKFIIPLCMPVGGMTTVGIYDFAQKCLVPVELLLNGLNATIMPKVIKLMGTQQGNKTSTVEINRYFYGLVSVIMLAMVFSILVLPWIIDWLVTKQTYRSAVEYIPYLAVIFIFRAMRLYVVVPNNVLKKMERITYINFAVLTLKVMGMIIFISLWGVYGIILSAGIAYGIEMILLAYYLRDDYHMKFNVVKLIVVPLLLVSVTVLGEFFLTNYVDATFVHIINSLICVVMLWFSYRKEIGLITPGMIK